MSFEPSVDKAEVRLRNLVEIESPTGHSEGILDCFRLVENWASPLLGRSPEHREIEGVPHLFGSAPTEGGVLILGHIDTVWPLGTLKTTPYQLRDGRAAGPGTFDMKAGIVAAIGALEQLDSIDDVSLLLTGDEEVGSITSRGLIEEAARRSRAVLVFEPSLEGAVKVARRGASIYRLQAHGKAAHAGLDPELGANALVEISRQVLSVGALSKTEVGTIVTPTVMCSGTTVNTVPEHAEVHLDVRAWSIAELQRVDAALRALEPADVEVTLELTGGINRPPMARELAQRLYELAYEVSETHGLPRLEAAAVGGGSDASFTAALGIPTLDGFGPLGDGAHASHEWVQLKSIVERATLGAGLIRRLREEVKLVDERHEVVADRSTP